MTLDQIINLSPLSLLMITLVVDFRILACEIC
jgi:hypothetical protein